MEKTKQKCYRVEFFSRLLLKRIIKNFASFIDAKNFAQKTKGVIIC